MKKFDCLSLQAPIFGPHLLEASAGTGKTFTIEHVVVRLILQGLPLEEILVVTFTKAATRELKNRIRANIEKALSFLSLERTLEWEYLSPLIGCSEAIALLSDALKVFDRAQIFTIHGFCFRMLKEFAFEAGKIAPISDPDDPAEVQRIIRRSMAEFWVSSIDSALLCPEQIALLLNKYDTLQELGTAIARAKNPCSTQSFYKWHRLFIENLKNEVPAHEFEEIKGNYKAQKGDFEEQIKYLTYAFYEKENPLYFRKLIGHKGTLFSFLEPSNRKVKTNGKHSEFWERTAATLGPIIEEASDRKEILAVLTTAWKEWEKKWLISQGVLQPDEILEQMREALFSSSFLEALQKRFKAVIIDEFQDTDPVQWEIFQKAFLKSSHLKTLYLVGDPKQSIYRFRSADVYTYFQAKEALGGENIYQLDTNFRSSKELLGALNALFSRNWLPLPQKNSTITYNHVLAGSSISSDLQDEKKALHFMIGDNFLPYVVAEIEKLKSKSVAIIVKDRYELQKALDLMRSRNIPCVARSHKLLSETFDFCALRELFEAIESPQDESACLIADHGPFSANYSYWKSFLEENSLAKFFAAFFQNQELSVDLKQTIEELLGWQGDIKKFFAEFEKVRRPEVVEDAVQIMTLHVSKGLEFDIVFALALASAASMEEEDSEEVHAEKNRQLYVAMTRAKKRLYVPYRAKTSKRLSPMDLFVKYVEKDEGDFLTYLEKLTDVSYEVIPDSLHLEKVEKEVIVLPEKTTSLISYTPSYIQSFTSLKEGQKIQIETTDGLPRGKATGIIVHEIFEAIFQSKIWKDDRAIELQVERKLRSTSLYEFKEQVLKMVYNTLSLPLLDFNLREVDDVFPEMEFLYQKDANFITGSMDLVFIHRGKLYLVDWKTNVLNSPTEAGVDEVMKAYDYELQANLYATALKKHFGNSFPLGGAFYIFVRTGVCRGIKCLFC